MNFENFFIFAELFEKTMSISIRNITKVYGEQKALNNVCINIEKGEIVGLLGPNGAGKSTLMKILCCYIKPTEGTADVCGYNISANPLEIKRLIGYLPESNPLYPDMYIREYLEYVANIYKVSDRQKRIDEVMEVTGLNPEKRKHISQLSKGYRQRVGLAQALIHDPQVLILDEPTTGLDPNQLTEIRSLIKSIGKDKTVILSTHIMQEVEAICNRVTIINKGIIIADDSTENIMSSQKGFSLDVELKKPCPKNPFEYFEKISRVKVLHDDSNSLKLNIQFKTDEDMRDKMFSYIIQKGYTLLSMNIPEKKLEEVFIDLVK